jgi:hypothetical protein
MIYLPSFHRLLEAVWRLPPSTTGQTLPTRVGRGVTILFSSQFIWTGGIQDILPAFVVMLCLLLMLIPTKHVSKTKGLFVPSSIRIWIYMTFQVDTYVRWCRNPPLWVCVSMYQTETGTPLIRFLSSLNFTGGLPLRETWECVKASAIRSTTVCSTSISMEFSSDHLRWSTGSSPSRETGFESRVSGWKSTNSQWHSALQGDHEGTSWLVCTIH